MRIDTVALTALAAIVWGSCATAQTAPGPSRVVVAAAKLPSVTQAPLYFKVTQITLPPGGKTDTSRIAGILYQVTGSTNVSLNGKSKTIDVGEGLFISSGAKAELQGASGGASILLRFSLSSADDLKRTSEKAPAGVSALYVTSAPIPDLKSGPYDITLTRSTFPAGMPSNAPHHRTGAALYYIISGTGANTVGGQTQSKRAGSFIYEPDTLIHRWGNPGTEPLVILQFNINPQGMPAVVPAAAPAKSS